MRKIEGLVGNTFGRWTVIAETPERKDGSIMYLCRCSCGTERAIRGNLLKRGLTFSCGCYRHEVVTKGGNAPYKDEFFSSYVNMRQRCENPKSPEYRNYGGRGIKVCDEWRDNYESFREWAKANNYRKGLSIDRIDCNGDYTPENCRWATSKQQARNKRNTLWVKFRGELMSLADAAELSGIGYDALRSRLRKGWTEDKLFAPINGKRSNSAAIKAGKERKRRNEDNAERRTDQYTAQSAGAQ